jgi:hypothetical protein
MLTTLSVCRHRAVLLSGAYSEGTCCFRLTPDSNGAGAGVTLEGPLAGALRRAAYLYRQPTNEQRVSVGTEWLAAAVAETSAAASRVLAGKSPFADEPRS